MSRLDQWQIDGIHRGIKEGRSQREIAKIIGCRLATVNGVSINLNGNDQGNEGSLCVPVSKGDIITFDSVSNSAFVPYKGQV